ncbi:MAG: thiol oxidoreductase, partial [Paracoccaceae bacterium]
MLVGTAAMAGPLDEPHLNIIPRTEAEAARVAAATALATTFDAPQAFEENSAGAATVRDTK